MSLKIISGAHALSVQSFTGHTNSPGIFFLSGYAADMTGSKATYLWDRARACGRGCTLFDYSGCGQSEGTFETGTIGRWLGDALAVFDQLCPGPQVLVGSSMGGWLMLLLGLLRPERVAGMVGIACGYDFTHRLLLPALSPEERALYHSQPEVTTQLQEGPFVVRRAFVEEAASHLLDDRALVFDVPVTYLHGDDDRVVPFSLGEYAFERTQAPSVQLVRIKGGIIDSRVLKI